MYSLQELWDQAVKDRSTLSLDSSGYEARMGSGVKIKRDNKTGEIVLLNTSTGGDSYRELTSPQIMYFRKYGWAKGSASILISNQKKKLLRTSGMLDAAIQNKDSSRRIKALQTAIENANNEIKYLEQKIK